MVSELTNRQRWDKWNEKGGKDFRQRGIEEANRILAEHKPEYLDPKKVDELENTAIAMQKQEIEAVKSKKSPILRTVQRSNTCI